MECEPLFAESDLEDESEVVEMEQETFLSEQTSFISPPYTLTLDTWQYQQSAPGPSDMNGPSTSSAASCENEGNSGQNGDVNGGSNESGPSSGVDFQPADDDPRICSPPFSSGGTVVHSVDPVLTR